MIPNVIRDQIKKIKELKVIHTNKAEYNFNPDTNTLYIPIYETDFNRMFEFLGKLEEISLCLDNKIEKATEMFRACPSLKSVNFIKKLNLAEVYDLSEMFYGCTSLEKIDLSDIVTSNKLKNIMSMFNRCISLKGVNFGDNFHSENIIQAGGLFFHCYNLETIHWKEHQSFDSLTLANSLFNGCKKLNQVDLRGVNFSILDDVNNMFYNTNPSLKVLVNDTFREDLL